MTPEESFSAQLSEDKTWRIRELSEVVRACEDAESLRRAALVRAAIPIIYAHWEGYFVHATNSYLTFVSDRRIMLTSLREEFWALTVRKRYKARQISSDSLFHRVLLELRTEADRAFKRGNFDRINGMSNLNSGVLKWCCEQIGIDSMAFKEYFDFIDEKLIERRNHIAHGASLRIDYDSVREYRDKVVELMRVTETEIENAVHRRSYLLATGR